MKDKIILWLIKQLSNKPVVEWFDNIQNAERTITFKIPLYSIYDNEKFTDLKYYIDKIINILK